MRIGEVARHLGVSIETIRNWERQGIVKTARTPLGQRVFTSENILEIQKVIKARSLERQKAQSRS